MKLSMLARLLISAMLALLASACSSPGGGLGPSASEFSSSWVDITMGGMMGLPAGPALGLSLHNKTDKSLWVTVAFEAPDPTQRGEVADKLEPRGQQLFTYPQRSITPDADYPIRLQIYTDAARTQRVESPETKFRFSQKDTQAFESLAGKGGGR
ncbi:MAG: hypothetical protein EXS08_02005 [Planctomycetes bacterium]|nr:hypothetical protein [Planctomycetota bacterium]